MFLPLFRLFQTHCFRTSDTCFHDTKPCILLGCGGVRQVPRASAGQHRVDTGFAAREPPKATSLPDPWQDSSYGFSPGHIALLVNSADVSASAFLRPEKPVCPLHLSYLGAAMEGPIAVACMASRSSRCPTPTTPGPAPSPIGARAAETMSRGGRRIGAPPADHCGRHHPRPALPHARPEASRHHESRATASSYKMARTLDSLPAAGTAVEEHLGFLRGFLRSPRFRMNTCG